ncbi:mRNA cap guanine-N7 methyltransferase-like [Copidosoma floridanum]|uniref:mRNA cap guanine-N7 methyltransferase-like n=1 Tax=Copidosoma floridanum TaxID=29053 RepID=UPI000C6FC1E3|nr:mRNA cap guanine-N7 methyltransferase-like [Copidosoma floridanum]
MTLYEAKKREKQIGISASFVHFDAFQEELDFEITFNVVVSNFSFHYDFGNDSTIKTAINNVSKHLVPGGFFLVTVPSASTIMTYKKDGKLKNKLFETSFMEKDSNGYIFKIIDTMELGCIEYFIDKKKLVETLKANKMQVVYTQNFFDFIISRASLDQTCEA